MIRVQEIDILTKLFTENGMLGIVVILIITGQLVPKIYYTKLLEDNTRLKESLDKSMALNVTLSGLVGNTSSNEKGGNTNNE